MTQHGGSVHRVLDRLARRAQGLIRSADRLLHRDRNRVEPRLSPNRAIEHPLAWAALTDQTADATAVNFHDASRARPQTGNAIGCELT